MDREAVDGYRAQSPKEHKSVKCIHPANVSGSSQLRKKLLC